MTSWSNNSWPKSDHFTNVEAYRLLSNTTSVNGVVRSSTGASLLLIVQFTPSECSIHTSVNDCLSTGATFPLTDQLISMPMVLCIALLAVLSLIIFNKKIYQCCYWFPSMGASLPHIVQYDKSVVHCSTGASLLYNLQCIPFPILCQSFYWLLSLSYCLIHTSANGVVSPTTGLLSCNYELSSRYYDLVIS